MIEVRNLVKQYGDHRAVDGLSFTIEKGKIYGFLGPNGAGKSTTMNMITGYLSPTVGDIVIAGHNILEEPEAAKKHIGYLPEIPPLYSDMTVKEYLFFAADLKGVARADRAAEVDKAVKKTHLEDVYNRLCANLSKGYKQRVGLAQAIIGDPDIIILDEPTIGLDPKQIIEIRDLIRSLAKDHTVIFSSHILSEVQEVCDHIMIIHRGHLLASGTPEELEQQLGTASVQAVVKSTDPAAVRSMLMTVEGVVDASCSVENSAEISANIKVKNGVDVREGIFRACVAANIPLLMLKASDFSLEHIFLELTKDRRIVQKKVIKRKKSTGEIVSAEKEADNK